MLNIQMKHCTHTNEGICDTCKSDANFVQVGRTIRCGHCAFVPKHEPCDCICHATNNSSKIISKLEVRCPHLHLEDLQAFLPMFIDAEFPKGGKGKWLGVGINEIELRGLAILHVTLFIEWCKKNIKTK